MGPADWLLGNQPAQPDTDSIKFDLKTFLVSLTVASVLGALFFSCTWTRAEEQSDELPDWPQGSPAARSDGVWTLQPQWQEPLEAESSHGSQDEDVGEEAEEPVTANATASMESGLDSFLGEEFEPLALEHVSTPEASPSQTMQAVGLLAPHAPHAPHAPLAPLAPMQLPASATSTPTLQFQPVSTGSTGAMPLPLNHLLPLPDPSGPARGTSGGTSHEEYLDLDTSMARSMPATPEWSDWSNVWFAGPEGPRRALTESQLLNPIVAGFPNMASNIAGWQPRHIAQHLHEPVEAGVRLYRNLYSM